MAGPELTDHRLSLWCALTNVGALVRGDVLNHPKGVSLGHLVLDEVQ